MRKGPMTRGAIHPGLPRAVLFYICFPNIIIQAVSFQNCPSLDDKLYRPPTNNPNLGIIKQRTKEMGRDIKRWEETRKESFNHVGNRLLIKSINFMLSHKTSNEFLIGT